MNGIIFIDRLVILIYSRVSYLFSAKQIVGEYRVYTDVYRQTIPLFPLNYY